MAVVAGWCEDNWFSVVVGVSPPVWVRSMDEQEDEVSCREEGCDAVASGGQGAC